MGEVDVKCIRCGGLFPREVMEVNVISSKSKVYMCPKCYYWARDEAYLAHKKPKKFEKK